MACAINGNTVKNGITNLLDRELTSSGIFEKEGTVYTAIPSQSFAAQEFVNGLNRAFSENVINSTGTRYSIQIPDTLIRQYVKSSPEGLELDTISQLHFSSQLSPESWNDNSTFMVLNYPEISDFTYNTLISFLKSVNPEFRVEEVDNLSTDGVTSLKDFLIQVKTLQKFSALPEEVAHVLVELLPDDNSLKQEAINNITSFPIYSQTLAQYKNVYVLPNGQPDYNKIKREAVAKLVGEYVTAISTDNQARVQELSKPKQGWFSRWFGKFLEWLGINMLNKTSSYADIAGIILSGKADMTLKNEKGIEDISFTDSYFYRLSEQSLYENAGTIISNPPPQLLEVISKFSKEFGKRFSEILKEPKYAELNTMLHRKGEEIGKINRLSEIKILLGEADIDLRAAMDSNAFVTGLKQFLEAVDRLDILSDSILKVVRSKPKATEFDEAIKNIDELTGYLGIYETFNNIISAELAQVLIDSGVGADVIESIQRTQLGFKNVNDHIMSRLRNDLFIFYKTLLHESNSMAAQTLGEDMERFKNDPKALAHFQERLDKLITTDEQILQMLSGRGRDIDTFSSLNHLINAAHTNGDVYISSIAKYIQDTLERAQLKSAVVLRNLYQQIDPIQKRLNEDAVATGKRITFVDFVYDADTGENRAVLTWLNPHKNIQPALDDLRRKKRDASRKMFETDRNSSEFAAVEAEFKKAQTDYNQFLEKYYNRPFVKEYYTFREKYESNTDFISAMQRWKELSEQIRNDESILFYEPEDTDAWERVSRSKRERANLLSEFDMEGLPKPESELVQVRILKEYFEEQSKFREEDEKQTERSYLTARNRYEQQVDFAMAEARKKNPKTIQDIEPLLQENLRDPRIRLVTAYEEIYDPEESLDYSFVKDLLMDRWYKKNVVIQRNEEFYEFEKQIIERLNELQAKGELSAADINIKEAYEDVRNILFGSRDDVGHINPDALTDEQKAAIVYLEEYIIEQKKEKPGRGANIEDFTPEDRVKYEDLTKVIKDPATPAGKKRAAISRRNGIIKKYQNVGKNKEMNDLLNLLGSMRRKVPTTHYWDKIASFIPQFAEYGRYVMSLGLGQEDNLAVLQFVRDVTETIDTEDWERLQYIIYEQALFESFLDWLETNRVDQYDWFVDSHSERTIFDPDNGKPITLKYVRSAVYNYTEPVLDEHKKVVFNRRFRKHRVKNEYRTGYNPETGEVELQVGVHITNREYNGFPEFLPLLPGQGAPADSPYHNQAYYDLDPDRREYLDLVRNADLLEQQKTPPRLRRWNQVPVMDLSNIESITPEHLKDSAQQKIDYVKSIFKKDTKLAETGADAEEAAKGEDTAKEIDQFTQTTIMQRIPKLGMSQKIPINRVSRDVLKSTAQFIIRAHEFEGRTNAEPVVKAIVRVMQDNEFKNQMSNKERAKKFESIYSQMILQEVPQTTLNTKSVRRIAKILTGNTALRMLADPIGGVINYGSAMVNNIIEASAGRYLNLQDLAVGKALAFRVNTHLMADYNKKANLSVDTLLFQSFDFIQGEFEEDLLDRSSSKDKHASIQQMLMIPRKTGELMAQTAIAMGILNRHKVQNSIDGKMYSAHELYEKDESGNNLKLKAGFPDEYNPVTGAKFLKLKKLINRVNHELHGNYAKLTQTEASRYAIGKLAENMKRWFMPAFQRRFGRETIDITYEDINEGYYRTTVEALRNVFGSYLRMDFAGGGRWLNVFMKTPRYRQNLQRMGAEVAQAFLMFVVFALILGYTGDDKNEQLEKNSWIHNTAILILLRTYSETTAYIPVPPFGFQEMKRNILTPFSLPSDAVSNFAAVAQLGLYQLSYWAGNPFGIDEGTLFYQKDSGFWYSEKGDSKLLKYVLNTLGHSGYTINPDQYIKQFDNLQKRLK